MYSMFSNLPASVKALLLLLGGASAVTIMMVLFGSYPQVTGILFAGLLIVGLLLAVYFILLRVLNRGKDGRFARMLKGQGAGVPSTVSGADDRARLDGLRRTFEKGVETFSSAGKSLYSLPWYMIVGEPGSGKTEAIRHCNISFPPGLQDEQQGSGGTINMDWWFTNHAVILDTAGRLIFEEVDASATSEWKEFLRLLKQNRLNCPINGLLLVIPAESLIKDTAEEIARKGGKIAQQLDLIQRTLDVRFPVFVVITKADLINGFREFFDSITDPELQHQMMGWSNPLPIDEPFNPELVDQHLETVLNRLRRRRLGLLQDPVNTEKADSRRSDQIDTLYDFPHSLSRIVPRLRLYLEKIFVVGEWSAKPLFIRGIYFTSSMREGEALDEDLAEALGVKVGDLPTDGRFWERERAYFLRDVFMTKVFKEHGLVTRSTNASRQHQHRKLSVMAAGLASVLILMGLTIYGALALKRTIGQHKDYMLAAAQESNWIPDEDFVHWNPVVYAPDFKGSTNFVYSTQEVLNVAGTRMASSQFHADLWRLNRDPIDIPWVFGFARLGRQIDELRADAQRALFESSVLHPLVSSARLKMRSADDPWSDETRAALEELIRIETFALDPATSAAAGDEKDAPSALPDLDRLFRYVLKGAGSDQAAKAAPEGEEAGAASPREQYLSDRNKVVFQQILTERYGEAEAQKAWPPEWLPEGLPFEENEALRTGLKRQTAQCVKTDEVRTLTEIVERTRAFQPKLQQFLGKEDKFLKTREKALLEEFEAALAKAETLADLEAVLKNWGQAFAELSQRGLVVGGEVFEGGYAEVETAVDTEFGEIKGLLSAAPEGPGTVEDAYHRAVARSIAQVRACLSKLSIPEAPKPKTSLLDQVKSAVEAKGEELEEKAPAKEGPAKEETPEAEDQPEGKEPEEASIDRQTRLVKDLRAALESALAELESKQLKDEETLQLLKTLERDFLQVKEVLAFYRFLAEASKDTRIADLKKWADEMSAVTRFRADLKGARETESQALAQLEAAFIDRFTSELPKPTTLRQFSQVSQDWDDRLQSLVGKGTALEAKAQALDTQFGSIKKGLNQIAVGPDDKLAEAYSRAVGKWTFEIEKLLAGLPAFKHTPLLAALKPRIESILETSVSQRLKHGAGVEQLTKAEDEYRVLTETLTKYRKRVQMYSVADQQLKAQEKTPDMAKLGAALDQLDREIELAAAETAKHADPKDPLSTKAEKVTSLACDLASRKRRYDLMNGILVTGPREVDEIKNLVVARTKELADDRETRNAVLDGLQQPKIFPTRLEGGTFDDGYYWKAAADLLRGWNSLAKRFNPDEKAAKGPEVHVLDSDELSRKYAEMEQVFAAYVKSYYTYWREQIPGLLDVSADTYTSYHETLKTVDRKEFDEVVMGLEKLCIALESAFNEVDEALPGDETAKFRKSSKVVRDEKFKTASVRMEKRWREVLRNWISLGDRALEARQIQLQDAKELQKKFLPFSVDDQTPEAVVERYWANLTNEAQRILLHESRLGVVNMIKEVKERYAKFPLVKPALSKPADELRPEDFLEARARLKKIGVALDNKDLSGIEEQELEWVNKIRLLAESLPAGRDEKWQCTITVLKPADQQTRALKGNLFSDIWAEASLSVAGTEKNRISTRADRDVQWEVPYPGKPIELKFYRFVHDDQADQKLVLPGPWSLLRLVVYGGQQVPKMTRSDDGRTWEIPLVMKDKEGTERALWVKAQFKTAIPAVKDWAGPQP